MRYGADGVDREDGGTTVRVSGEAPLAARRCWQRCSARRVAWRKRDSRFRLAGFIWASRFTAFKTHFIFPSSVSFLVACLSVYLYICPSVCLILYVYLSIYPSIRLSVYPSIYLSLSVCLSFCLSVLLSSLSIGLVSVCLSVNNDFVSCSAFYVNMNNGNMEQN